MKKLKWYIVDNQYVKYLKTFDDKVEDIEYKDNLKPYLGIVLKVGEFDYYVPISSPKKKHNEMKDSLDFIKIRDKNSNILGVLNLNNMIPILNSEICLLKYEEISKFRKFKNHKEELQYIKLLDVELNIINSKIETITKNAKKLYELMASNNSVKLNKRCCNFKLLEEKALLYK